MLGSQPMTDSQLPAVYKVAHSDIRSLPVASIKVRNERERPLDEPALADLERSIERHGLLQPIGIQFLGGTAASLLVFGLHRLTVFQRKYEAGKRRFEEAGDASERDRWAHIPCICFRPEMPFELANLFEIEENLARKELTHAERSAQTLKLAALLKTPALAALAPPGNSRERPEKSGRGRPKGHTQVVADKLGVDHSTVRNRVKAAEKLAGEKIDLEKDDAGDLLRKAEAAESEARRRQREPSPKTAKAKRPAPKLIDTDEEADATAKEIWFKTVAEALKLIEEWAATRDDKDLAWYAQPAHRDLNRHGVTAERVTAAATQLGRVASVTFGGAAPDPGRIDTEADDEGRMYSVWYDVQDAWVAASDGDPGEAVKVLHDAMTERRFPPTTSGDWHLWNAEAGHLLEDAWEAMKEAEKYFARKGKVTPAYEQKATAAFGKLHAFFEDGLQPHAKWVAAWEERRADEDAEILAKSD